MIWTDWPPAVYLFVSVSVILFCHILHPIISWVYMVASNDQYKCFFFHLLNPKKEMWIFSSLVGTRSTGGNDQIQKGANECTNGNDANWWIFIGRIYYFVIIMIAWKLKSTRCLFFLSSPTGLVTVQVVEYVGYRHPANSSNGELAALAISDGPFQAKTKGLPVETNAGIGKSRNGTSVRSVKRMLSESKNAKRAKERKTAGNPRRSKGKVKGSSD